jgi:hypothetical protein
MLLIQSRKLKGIGLLYSTTYNSTLQEDLEVTLTIRFDILQHNFIKSKLYSIDPKRLQVPSKARFIGWKNSYKCMGQLRHNICVFSLEDLPELVTRNEFFANKFLLSFDPISYQCMEEWVSNKVSTNQVINIIHYCRLIFVMPYSVNPSCARLLNSVSTKAYANATSVKL